MENRSVLYSIGIEWKDLFKRLKLFLWLAIPGRHYVLIHYTPVPQHIGELADNFLLWKPAATSGCAGQPPACNRLQKMLLDSQCLLTFGNDQNKKGQDAEHFLWGFCILATQKLALQSNSFTSPIRQDFFLFYVHGVIEDSRMSVSETEGTCLAFSAW